MTTVEACDSQLPNDYWVRVHAVSSPVTSCLWWSCCSLCRLCLCFCLFWVECELLCHGLCLHQRAHAVGLGHRSACIHVFVHCGLHQCLLCFFLLIQGAPVMCLFPGSVLPGLLKPLGEIHIALVYCSCKLSLIVAHKDMFWVTLRAIELPTCPTDVLF